MSFMRRGWAAGCRRGFVVRRAIQLWVLQGGWLLCSIWYVVGDHQLRPAYGDEALRSRYDRP